MLRRLPESELKRAAKASADCLLIRRSNRTTDTPERNSPSEPAKRIEAVKKPLISETVATFINVLSVGSTETDHLFLRDSFNNQNAWARYGRIKCILHTAATLSEAQTVLREYRIAVVLCDNDSMSGAYPGMLECLAGSPDSPLLIVTSRLADERLWVEMLNLGAYDVLAKPFDLKEVVWTIGSAWLRWADRQNSAVNRERFMKAAS
jgi:hypothetical protein